MNIINKEILVNINIADMDKYGSSITGIRLNVNNAYTDIPDLLKEYIDSNEEDNESWQQIQNRINYIYSAVSIMLAKLDEETNFILKVKEDTSNNKLLIFKPNLISPICIDPTTHGAGLMIYLNTNWSIIAAIMRWFHDYANIHYSHMAIAEGGCSIELYGVQYSKYTKHTITNEAIFEGRSHDFYGDDDNFYGGWGFYFARKYLSYHCTSDEDDNPMNSYEESCKGIYLSPGEAINKMMIYDINQLQIDRSRGRTIDIPDGQNYSEIVLHKVIVGGNSSDLEDIKLYPCCVLINVPTMKLHAQDLITNALKNLGLGLYPLQCAVTENPSDTNWLYGSQNTKIPSYRSLVPHSPLIMKIDGNTHLPMRDKYGRYIIKRTAGFSGTQCDIIKAVQSQGILIVNISDNINIVNVVHAVPTEAQPIPEGFIWASLDCVALDTFCARYCFNTLPMLESKKLKKEYHFPTEFIHDVPIAKIKKQQIVSTLWVDSPLFRYYLYNDAEKRGIGSCSYYIKGVDLTNNTKLASYHGHLISLSNNNMNELLTKTLYYNSNSILHSLQPTILSYAKSNDTLFHSNLYKELLAGFDENHDGIIDYNERGTGFENSLIEVISNTSDISAFEKYADLKATYLRSLLWLKYSNSKWNADGHDFLKMKILTMQLYEAFKLSNNKELNHDLFFHNMVYGKGYWSSFKTAEYIYNMSTIYGGTTTETISEYSAYGSIFKYCDIVLNNSHYTSSTNALLNYFNDLKSGIKPLPFTFYIPIGFGKMNRKPIPNTVETNDPKLIFTTEFNEIW